jgi:hypothetical protein
MTDMTREEIEWLAERLEAWKHDLRCGVPIPGADQDLHAAAFALLALLDRAEAAEKERDEARSQVGQLREALQDAIDGYAEGSQYKDDTLRVKHGDDKEIERLRAVLEASDRQASKGVSA